MQKDYVVAETIVRVDAEMRDCLNDILNENLLLTLAQINREPKIHDRTVASAFERMLFRVKLVRPLPAERNRPHVIQRRAGYTNLFMRYAVVNYSVFVDELNTVTISALQEVTAEL